MTSRKIILGQIYILYSKTVYLLKNLTSFSFFTKIHLSLGNVVYYSCANFLFFNIQFFKK